MTKYANRLKMKQKVIKDETGKKKKNSHELQLLEDNRRGEKNNHAECGI